MKANVGNFDRQLRIISGVVIILLGFYFQSLWGLVGIVPLTTGLVKWCPAYLPFKISTAKKDSCTIKQ